MRERDAPRPLQGRPRRDQHPHHRRRHDGRPGDIIVGDEDGLLAFQPHEAAEAIEKALKQQAAEEATMQAIREGRWDRSFVDRLEARCAN